jgi:DNA-binding MarR family transcriptional regulator
MTSAADQPSRPAAPPLVAPPVVASTSFLLIVAGRMAQRRLDGALGERGLALRHVGALGHLARQPDLSYSDLARRAGITPQSMRATVRQLEQLGAVRRTLPGHGHAARLEVTPHGHDLLVWAGEQARALDDDLLGDVAPDQRDALRRALSAVAMPDGPPMPPAQTPSPSSARR